MRPNPWNSKTASLRSSSAYDDLIENNTRRIAILEEMARRIFEEWFVHFRAPGCEGLPMVESAIGPIPQGWEVKQLGEIARAQVGRHNDERQTVGVCAQHCLCYSASGWMV